VLQDGSGSAASLYPAKIDPSKRPNPSSSPWSPAGGAFVPTAAPHS